MYVKRMNCSQPFWIFTLVCYVHIYRKRQKFHSCDTENEIIRERRIEREKKQQTEEKQAPTKNHNNNNNYPIRTPNEANVETKLIKIYVVYMEQHRHTAIRDTLIQLFFCWPFRWLHENHPKP